MAKLEAGGGETETDVTSHQHHHAGRNPGAYSRPRERAVWGQTGQKTSHWQGSVRCNTYQDEGADFIMGTELNPQLCGEKKCTRFRNRSGTGGGIKPPVGLELYNIPPKATSLGFLSQASLKNKLPHTDAAPGFTDTGRQDSSGGQDHSNPLHHLHTEMDTSVRPGQHWGKQTPEKRGHSRRTRTLPFTKMAALPADQSHAETDRGPQSGSLKSSASDSRAAPQIIKGFSRGAE